MSADVIYEVPICKRLYQTIMHDGHGDEQNDMMRLVQVITSRHYKYFDTAPPKMGNQAGSWM